MLLIGLCKAIYQILTTQDKYTDVCREVWHISFLYRSMTCFSNNVVQAKKFLKTSKLSTIHYPILSTDFLSLSYVQLRDTWDRLVL